VQKLVIWDASLKCLHSGELLVGTLSLGLDASPARSVDCSALKYVTLGADSCMSTTLVV